jgi:hydroxypyruvate isomerase
MISFAPNISWLFPELPFQERPIAAARAGFSAIEFGFPSRSDLDALEAAHKDLGMQIVLFNQDVPIWDVHNRGYLSDPKRRDEFYRKLDEALEIARRLKVLKIMLSSGVVLEGLDREPQITCIVENLRYAAPLAEQAEVLLTIEALNPYDNPGIFLTSSREGVEIVKRVNHPHVKFQYDTYHMQLLEGNLSHTIAGNSEWIGHIQYADLPGRHEPGTGEINFPNLTRAIENSGYAGYIGLEYLPLAKGAAALDWVPSDIRKPIQID